MSNRTLKKTSKRASKILNNGATPALGLADDMLARNERLQRALAGCEEILQRENARIVCTGLDFTADGRAVPKIQIALNA